MFERQIDILLDNHDARACGGDRADTIPDATDVHRRQSGRWFVQEQYLWVQHQRPSHAQHVALAPTEDTRRPPLGARGVHGPISPCDSERKSGDKHFPCDS